MVIDRCAKDRPGQDGTWITREIRGAYRRLYRSGWAHSVEVWQDDQLVGGLYGLAIDRVFFGESMFSRSSNASKCALVALAGYADVSGIRLIDCQLHTGHLIRMGAREISRKAFLSLLRKYIRKPYHQSSQQPISQTVLAYL